MKKFLYYTDPHNTNKPPLSRKAGYQKSILSKMYQIDAISREHKVDLVICGGDLTQRPQEDYEVFNDLYEYFKQTYVKHEMMVGLTHDYRSNIHDLDNSIMGALGKTGVFNIVGESHTWQLEGITVYSAHMAITPSPFFGHFVLYKDLQVPCDIVLISHLHMPFGTQVVNNRTFISPGSIGRNSHDLYNINRVPQCVIVTIEGKEFSIEYIDLKCELDVFKEVSLLNTTEQFTMSGGFTHDTVNSIELTKCHHDDLDINGVMKKIGEKYSPESLEEAFKFKQKVENES